MIGPVSTTNASGIDATRTTSTGSPAPIRADARPAQKADTTETPARRLASLGPPIDQSRVNEVRAAIADGSYTVDADRLAAAMLALDLPKGDA